MGMCAVYTCVGGGGGVSVRGKGSVAGGGGGRRVWRLKLRAGPAHLRAPFFEEALEALLLLHLFAQPMHAALVLVHAGAQLDDDVLALRKLLRERGVPLLGRVEAAGLLADLGRQPVDRIRVPLLGFRDALRPGALGGAHRLLDGGRDGRIAIGACGLNLVILVGQLALQRLELQVQRHLLAPLRASRRLGL